MNQYLDSEFRVKCVEKTVELEGMEIIDSGKLN